jgi:hypothetical protein
MGPEDMADSELCKAAFRVATSLVDGLGPVVQASFSGRAVDDSTWHHPWATTVEMFVRTAFMTSQDACGTAAVGLRMNASAASTGIIRTVAECHVLMRWVLDGATAEEKRGRVLAVTSTAVKRTRRSVDHWERTATGTRSPEMAAQIRQALEATETDLDTLASRNDLIIPRRPENQELFDSYLPGGYFVFALLSNMGAHPGNPFLFYGGPRSNVLDWDFKGLHIERAYWITQACSLHLENCKIAAPICGWTNYEVVLARIGRELGPLAAEAVKRLNARRDPAGIWT